MPPHINADYQQNPVPYQYPPSPATIAAPPPEKKLSRKYRYLMIGIFAVLFVSIIAHIYNHFSETPVQDFLHLKKEIAELEERISQNKLDSESQSKKNRNISSRSGMQKSRASREQSNKGA
jgi:cell division protein FtsL